MDEYEKWRKKATPYLEGEDYDILTEIRNSYEKEIEEFALSIEEKYKEQEINFYKNVYAVKSKKR